MTPEEVRQVRKLLIDKARLHNNEDTGIFAYHTYDKAQADKCAACIVAGREKGFQVRDNRIYFTEYAEGSRDYLQACRSFAFDSGISNKVPFQTAQSFGSFPYIGYISAAFYNGETSNLHTSVSDWHIFVVLLRKPVDIVEMGTLEGVDHMALKTAFRGKANGSSMLLLYGGDGRQDVVWIFDCLAIVCHNVNSETLALETSRVGMSAGTFFDMLLF